MTGATKGLRDRKQGRVGVGGKIKWRFSEVNSRVVSRGQDKLVASSRWQRVM
jgi:hypothetical protein